MDTSPTRRALLTGVGSGMIATLAGCSALGSDNSGPPDPEPYRIGDVILGSRDSEPHQLDFLIERDDEIVHWETYDIAPYDGVLDGVIVPASAFGGCTRGFYTLAVRLKDGTQDTFDGNPRPLFDGTLREIWIKDGGNDFEVLAGTKRHTCQTTETPST